MMEEEKEEEISPCPCLFVSPPLEVKSVDHLGLDLSISRLGGDRAGDKNLFGFIHSLKPWNGATLTLSQT
jgi:hypothetical protein